MAKIISFNSKKNNNTQPVYEEKKNSGVNWTYKDKIRSHKMVIFYRMLLLVIIVVALTVTLAIQDRTRVFSEATVLSSAENHSIQSENVLDFNEAVLSYGKDGAACVDSKGNALWNITYEMQSPMISMQGDMVAIGDYGARVIYIMNTEGSVGEIETTMPIYKFCISASGELAVVLNDSDVTWIYLYDSLGEVIAYFKTTMTQSGFPMDLSVSDNGKLVSVSFVYVDSGEIRSSVSFYNFGDVGQNETDNYVSGYNYSGTVIPMVRFMDDEAAFAVSDDRIIFYKGAEKPVSLAEHLINDEIQKVFYNERYVGLVFYSDQADYRYRIEIYNKSGSLVDERDCNIDFKNITIQDEYAYIYSESQCMIYRIGGSIRYEGSLPKSAYLLLPGSRVDRFTTVNSDSIDTISLK